MSARMCNIMLHMPRRTIPSTPTPEALVGDRGRSLRLVGFRLSDPEYDALLALAKRAGIGHSALARRIVEHYLTEHAPAKRRARK